MIFPKKLDGIFVDLNDHTFSVAKSSSLTGPMVVDELKSCPATNPEAIEQLLKEIQPKRTAPGNYVHAACSVYTARRLVRRVTLDPKRFSEANYLDEMASSQCRISPDEYMLSVVSCATGMDVHALSAPEKEVVYVGMGTSEIVDTQKRLLGLGVFPERLEVGTLSLIGGVIDYLRFSNNGASTLILEMGDDSIQCFVVTDGGFATARGITQGIQDMVPLVQKELGLKDDEAARRLFYSNTFDFTGMAAALTKKLIKELQSSIGFYEVQTGQSIGQVICTLLPPKLAWIQGAIATQLGVEPLIMDYKSWLPARGVTMRDRLLSEINHTTLGLLSSMITHGNAAVQEKH